MKKYFTLLVVAIAMIMAACNGDSSESRLRETVEQSNKECPAIIDHVTVLKEIKLDDKLVTYVCEIDETKLPMDSMLSQRAVYTQNIQTLIKTQLTNSQSSNAPFLQLVMEAGRGVRHHYVGNRSGKSMDVDITNEQMQQLSVPFEKQPK